ncbi:MAG TPA: hypothetical protein VGQ81_07550 [Acidobacteriota bacterium]|jgi:hypothetical protein|nr:hypothetical protein [Acidobacteriota bacterium]
MYQLSVVRGPLSVAILVFLIFVTPIETTAQDTFVNGRGPRYPRPGPQHPTPETPVFQSAIRNPQSEFRSPQSEIAEAAHKLTKMVAVSGRVFELAVKPSERITGAAQLAPGAPPLLSFRYFEGKMRHRFGNLDLVLDDAAH